MPEPFEPMAIGADLGGNNLRMAVVGGGGRIVARYHRSTSADRTVSAVLAEIAAGVESLKRDALAAGHAVVGVGLGVPGLVRPEDGSVLTSPNFPGWVDVPLRRELERRLCLPVHVENDVNAIAVGEKVYGAGRGVRNFLVVTLGTGVGGGLILEDRLWRGPDGTAGEVGHMTVWPKGLRCACGSIGCLEAYCSATALARRGIEEGLFSPEEGGADLLAAMARQGNRRARRFFREAGTALGIILAGLANLLNLEMVVVGGGAARSWELLETGVAREIKKRAFSVPARRLQVVPTVLFDDAGVLGAASLSGAAM